MNSIYLIGSLRNPNVVKVGAKLRAAGFDVFDDWASAGPQADDHLQAYERSRGHNMAEALKGYAAKHIFELDKKHLDRCDGAVMVAPAGKSGHLELGYTIGKGKPGYILFDKEPERIEVMYQFATGIFYDFGALLLTLEAFKTPNRLEGDINPGDKLIWYPHARARTELTVLTVSLGTLHKEAEITAALYRDGERIICTNKESTIRRVCIRA